MQRKRKTPYVLISRKEDVILDWQEDENMMERLNANSTIQEHVKLF